MIECKHKDFTKLFFYIKKKRKEFQDYIKFKGLFLYKHVYEVYRQFRKKGVF